MVVAEALRDPRIDTHAHVLNLCEVFYDLHRRGGEPAATEAMADLEGLGVEVHEESPSTLWQSAARIKAIHRRVSLADCFAIALAQSLGGTVLTTDHHEFDAIAAAGVCVVEFIR